MEAIEFTTEAKDGVIKIPKKYQAQLQDTFRVIILQESSSETKKVPRSKRVLRAVKIKTKGFKFDREEANAR